MELRYQYRIYPTDDQVRYFSQEIGNQRFVWNYFLDREKTTRQDTGKFNFYLSNSSHLTILKKEYEFLKVGDSTALQATLRSLEAAMKMCFKKVLGFPKFKKRKEYDGSYTIVRTNGFKFNSSAIKLPKIGWVKWKLHRDIPSIFKTATIIQDGKHWYISVIVNVNEEIPTQDPRSAIGIDFNSADFVTSDGELISNPKYLKKSRKLLARRQRQLSKSKKGSNRRKIKQLKVRNTYRKVRNQRKDFVHKLSHSIVKSNDLICLEDLNVKGMQKFNGKMIQDNCFSMLRSAIQYKCQLYGKHFVLIDRFDPSSKACNNCGEVNQSLTLSMRTYDCSYCGASVDRDLNAALNIRDWGLFKWLNSTVGAMETGRGDSTNGRGDTNIGEVVSTSRYVSLNRQKFLQESWVN